MVYTFWGIKDRWIRAVIVNTVHDSLPTEVHKDDVDKYEELVVDCFLDKTYDYLAEVYGMDITIPLGVGFKAGTHWGEGTEHKTSRSKKR
jgi:DNA polymerase I-like protein with 3'-5' exonuclease and polymerase domains